MNKLGFLNRQKISDVLARSKAGIITFLPAPNRVDAQPNKMFEYMSATLPNISSAFARQKEIVEGSGCRICVDPLNPKAIGEAVQYLIKHSEEAEKMGENGRLAVEEKYNWVIDIGGGERNAASPAATKTSFSAPPRWRSVPNHDH